MKANELPIIDFLLAANVQFVIPVYQRNYDWTNNECKELLNDIISVEMNFHALGTDIESADELAIKYVGA